MAQLSDEAVLTQLGFNPNETILSQFKKVVETTPGFDELKKHIITLNNRIKHYGGHIGLSSSSNYLKIKNARSSNELQEEIELWAKKHKVSLIKSGNSNHYYIEGKQV